MGTALVLVLWGWWQVSTPQRAAAYYRSGEYNRSAALFEAVTAQTARYNAANALYRAGGYERALELYGSFEPAEAAFAARLWYNRGNTLVRLKEFAKAREAFARSLALQYDEAALENMMHILHAEAQDHMLTGRQEGEKRAQEQAGETTQSGKQKEGGGSNQPGSAQQNRGAGAQGRKAELESRLQFSDKGNSKLSSKQYELINQRSVHETKPW